jgi:hypothetical protein
MRRAAPPQPDNGAKSGKTVRFAQAEGPITSREQASRVTEFPSAESGHM